ncbi:sigma factor [Thermoanaerobacterium sp. PSU-2]|uniref:RNA polymerase sigma factor n=1 Tax=Thermoanaerobacterium sp. PSU-2 TaxID=1930849 RepID=UPI001F0A5759|nr:sigma factor [Thermoanaerobacterium sp. PSU-2]
MKDERFEDFLIDKMAIIYKYLIKIGASYEDAEDIVQDTICKVVEYVDSINTDDIYPWLFKVSINKYYNLYNRKRRRKSVSMIKSLIASIQME